jgi:hypothetical protein
MSEVKNFQRNLKDDSELRQFYIEADQVEDVESGFSDEESLNQINKTKSNKTKSNKTRKTNISSFETMILNLYDNSVKELNKTKEQLYKAKNQIDVDEVKMRYLKLDLNNAQVDVENKTKEILELKNNYEKDIVTFRNNEKEYKRVNLELTNNYVNEKKKNDIIKKNYTNLNEIYMISCIWLAISIGLNIYQYIY